METLALKAAISNYRHALLMDVRNNNVELKKMFQRFYQLENQIVQLRKNRNGVSAKLLIILQQKRNWLKLSIDSHLLAA